jgi:pilus assembly protein CpaF
VLRIRKRRPQGPSFQDLSRNGTFSATLGEFLTQCLAARVNLLLVAPQLFGTSPVFAALASVFAAEQRTVVLHDPTDGSAVRDKVASLTLTERNAATLVPAAARMGFSYLFVDVLSPTVAMAVIDSIGLGTRGVVAEMHSPSLLQGLDRLPSALCAARPTLGMDAAQGMVACCFDVALEVGYLRDGRLCVLRVSEVVGWQEQRGWILRDIFSAAVPLVASEGGSVAPISFRASGHAPRFFEELRKRGVDVKLT